MIRPAGADSAPKHGTCDWLQTDGRLKSCVRRIIGVRIRRISRQPTELPHRAMVVVRSPTW